MTLLSERIEDKGLKQKWIAEQVGISDRTLQNWLKYEGITQIIQFGKLCEVLGIELVEIAEDIQRYIEKEKKEPK